MPWKRSLKALGVALLGAIVTTPSLAQTEDRTTDPVLGIELNKLEPIDEGCRAYLLVRNEVGEAFDSLELDLVTFQPDGVIGSHLLVELAPVPASKTVVKPFELLDVDCASIDSVLLNDVPTCSGPTGGLENCLAAVDLTSRAGEFWK